MQWRVQGHSVNRQTPKTNFLCSRPKTQLRLMYPSSQNRLPSQIEIHHTSFWCTMSRICGCPEPSAPPPHLQTESFASSTLWIPGERREWPKKGPKQLQRPTCPKDGVQRILTLRVHWIGHQKGRGWLSRLHCKQHEEEFARLCCRGPLLAIAVPNTNSPHKDGSQEVPILRFFG